MQGLLRWHRGKVYLPMQEMQEIRVCSLSQEETLEYEMEIPSGIFDWKIPWTEEPGGLQSMGSQKSWTRLSTAQEEDS